MIRDAEPGGVAAPALRPVGLDAARGEFEGGRGYLAAATNGLPPRRTVEALRADLAAWAAGQRDATDYDGVVTRSRALYAGIVGVPADRVAIGAQTSALVSLVAAAVPRGAEVLVADGDFSSVHFPFVERAARGEIRLRSAPLASLAEEVGDATWLVAFSLVQSATGAVADEAAILAAAFRHGTRTLADLTQAAGVLPVDAARYDVTVCHAYKWLCAPRGAAFLTVATGMQPLLRPAQAGWYAGEDVWGSVYGPEMRLASDARRFDVSPAWEAWAGAEASLGLFAALDAAELWRHASGLGDALCDALGVPRQGQAIVTLPDPEGEALRALGAAGLRASGRAGRVRLSFHLWNDEEDVAAAAAALGAR